MAKVERSHSTDQDKSCRHLSLYSLKGLRKRGRVWQKRYDAMPKQALGYNSPDQAEPEKLIELPETTGDIKMP